MSGETFESVFESLFGDPNGNVLKDRDHDDVTTEQGHDEVDFMGVNNDIYLTTPQLIRKRGYPEETHELVTEDGYILNLHRIPHGNYSNPPSTAKRPVVVLQQGILSSSAVWVMGSPEKALGFRLADQGYDVWLLNSRGTTYSKGHRSLDVESKEYWNFSFHEMAFYDLPANIDYILNLTGQAKLIYIGHSQGTTIFFAGMTLRPEYNSKVELMCALAPVAFLGHLTSPIGKLSPFINQFEFISNFMGINQLLPNSQIMTFFGAAACHKLSPIQGILHKLLNTFCGDDSHHLNRDLLPIILGHVPAGISTKNVLHFGQLVNSGEFQQFNYGKEINQVKYCRPTPPKYDLKNVTAPVGFYYSDNDCLSTETDVEHLAKLLPNLKIMYQVPLDKFNHMDFLWANSVDIYLFNKLEQDLKEVTDLGQVSLTHIEGKQDGNELK